VWSRSRPVRRSTAVTIRPTATLLTKRQPREHRTHTPSNRIRPCGESLPRSNSNRYGWLPARGAVQLRKSDPAMSSGFRPATGAARGLPSASALGARRQGYYSPVCENLRHSRGLGRRAPVSEETRRVQNLRLAPEASETAGGIAEPEPGAGRARVTVWRFFSSVIVRKSTERKNQPEIASPTWRRTRVFVAGSKTTATFWILAIAVPTSVRSGRSDSADPSWPGFWKCPRLA
jgi:hypothetical protein